MPIGSHFRRGIQAGAQHVTQTVCGGTPIVATPSDRISRGAWFDLVLVGSRGDSGSGFPSPDTPRAAG